MGNKRVLIDAMLWYMIRGRLESVNGGLSVFNSHKYASCMPAINLELPTKTELGWVQ